MKILLLCHGYNCLTQRLHVELSELGHSVSVELDVNDAVTINAVDLFKPDLIIAPYLKRAIAEQVWRNNLCWIIHPGIIGDRGPSSLDWAIINDEPLWGVTVIQANEVMDGGNIWANVNFAMPKEQDALAQSKSSIYRHQVTNAAWQAVQIALTNYQTPDFCPPSLSTIQLQQSNETLGQWRCVMTQADRQINWQHDDSAQIMAKINSADGNPGVKDTILGVPVYVYDATFDAHISGEPGQVIARRNEAIAIATTNGAIWLGHLRIKPEHQKHQGLKLPASMVLNEQLCAANIHESNQPFCKTNGFQDIYYQIGDRSSVNNHKQNDTAYLYFNFYNGAMSTSQCQRLTQAYLEVSQLDVACIVLMGGDNFWSNGIHLNVIEYAHSSADESWHNINAMNDLCQAIINTSDKLTLSVLRGNAGAGGVFLALATDKVIAHNNVILNPHYKSMGNLFGSEYWTYTLPKRVGDEQARHITNNRLPISADIAKSLNLIDDSVERLQLGETIAQQISKAQSDDNFTNFIANKQAQRLNDENNKPLAQYRAEELAQMKLNFYGFDPSYHVARYHFVYKLNKARTPPYLAIHRQAKFNTK